VLVRPGLPSFAWLQESAKGAFLVRQHPGEATRLAISVVVEASDVPVTVSHSRIDAGNGFFRLGSGMHYESLRLLLQAADQGHIQLRQQPTHAVPSRSHRSRRVLLDTITLSANDLLALSQQPPQGKRPWRG
jgi:hypothetical protein